MFTNLKRLFFSGRINEHDLSNAMARGWITAAEYQEITGEACSGE